MIKEIDKIMAVRDVASETDKKLIDNAVNVISDAFKALTMSTRKFILSGEREVVNLDKAMEALKLLKEKVGDDFPNIETRKDAVLYITKFGKDIVLA